MIVIETDRLIIRESSGRDFSRIYCMMLSAGEEETADRISEDEDEELEKFLAYIHTVYPVFGFGLWTVCLKAGPLSGSDEVPEYPEGTEAAGTSADTGEGCIIGRCGLQPVSDENSPLGRIELGYLIDRKFRGRGYALEACGAILQYAFEKLKIEEIFVNIDQDNEPSTRLAGKLGFRRREENLWGIRNPRCK